MGCADALKIDKHWSNLVASSQQRRRYFKVLNPWTLNPCTKAGNERLKGPEISGFCTLMKVMFQLVLNYQQELQVFSDFVLQDNQLQVFSIKLQLGDQRSFCISIRYT